MGHVSEIVKKQMEVNGQELHRFVVERRNGFPYIAHVEDVTGSASLSALLEPHLAAKDKDPVYRACLYSIPDAVVVEEYKPKTV